MASRQQNPAMIDFGGRPAMGPGFGQCAAFNDRSAAGWAPVRLCGFCEDGLALAANAFHTARLTDYVRPMLEVVLS